MSQQYADKVENNKAALNSIIKTIIFCGRKNLPLRGYTEENGNFRALINFPSETDTALLNHLEKAPRNAQYLSPGIQNELIELCRKQIRQSILKECKAAKHISILADETADVKMIFKFWNSLPYS